MPVGQDAGTLLVHGSTSALVEGDVLELQEVLGDAYWCSVPHGAAKARTTVTGTVEGQKISIDSGDVPEVRIWLHDRLLDLDQEIELVINGKSTSQKVSRTKEAIEASLDSRTDRDMMASAYIDLKIE